MNIGEWISIFHALPVRNLSDSLIELQNICKITSVWLLVGKPESQDHRDRREGRPTAPCDAVDQLASQFNSHQADPILLSKATDCLHVRSMILLKGTCVEDNTFGRIQKTLSTNEIKEDAVNVDTYHTPAVASHKVNAVIKDCTARATSTLQNGSLEYIPLVTFWVIAFHKHYIKVGET